MLRARELVAFAALLVALAAPLASGKILEGLAQLDSEHTEIYIGKFAFSAGQIGIHPCAIFKIQPAPSHTSIDGSLQHFDATLISQPSGNIVGKLTSANPKKSYFDGVNHQLVLCLFDDTKWQVYQGMTGEGSLCRNSIQQASMCFAPSFEVSDANGKANLGKLFDFQSKIDFRAYTHVRIVLCAHYSHHHLFHDSLSSSPPLYTYT